MAPNTSHSWIIYDIILAVLLLSINQYTKFEVCSLTDFKDMTGSPAVKT